MNLTVMNIEQDQNLLETSQSIFNPLKVKKKTNMKWT